MPLRPPAGFRSAFYDPLRNPDAPTGVTATAGNTQASVAFVAPANPGGSAISEYQVVTYTGSTYVKNQSGASSPITVTGLSNGTAYTFNVWALNSFGPGVWSAVSNSVTPELLQRGLFAGGLNASSVNVNVIDYVSIPTTGNATDFGDLTTARNQIVGCSSDTRGVFGGGENSTISANSLNIIDYVTIASTGDAIDFGDLLTNFGRLMGACSSSTRGVFGGGRSTTFSSVMQYVTIATLGNSTSFGNLTVTAQTMAGCASTTRGLFGGGINSSSAWIATIGYITIATTGNATFFGNLTSARRGLAACSSSTRGVFAGGDTSTSEVNIIDYVTIATTGNATDFGDLTTTRTNLAGCAGLTRGIFGGGNFTSTYYNVIDYITIASVGNAIDFGDLTVARYSLASCSSSHGGLS